jgi:hypothetical protein
VAWQVLPTRDSKALMRATALSPMQLDIRHAASAALARSLYRLVDGRTCLAHDRHTTIRQFNQLPSVIVCKICADDSLSRIYFKSDFFEKYCKPSLWLLLRYVCNSFSSCLVNHLAVLRYVDFSCSSCRGHASWRALLVAQGHCFGRLRQIPLFYGGWLCCFTAL